MFKVVQPKNYHSNQDSIHLFHKAIENNQGLAPLLQEAHDATYLLENNEPHGYVGGALILKRKLSPFLRTMGNSKIPFPEETSEVWVCSVGLHIQNPTFDFEAHGKAFYKRLYQELLNFGALHTVNFLYLLLDPGEYLCTEALGFWPYVKEVRPQDSLDGLFHGLLSLRRELPSLKQALPKPALLTELLAA